MSKLRPPASDVVLVAGWDLVTEVELGDEGLALLSRSDDLNKNYNSTQYFLYSILYSGCEGLDASRKSRGDFQGTRSFRSVIGLNIS